MKRLKYFLIIELGHFSYCCAYGGLHALPIITGAFAFLCTVNASITCDYLRVYFHDTPDGLGIGLWTVEDLQADGTHYPCKAYPDEIEVDGKLRFARAMDRLSTIVGAVILLLICIPACMKFDAKMYFKRVAYICFALSMTTMLTLVSSAAFIVVYRLSSRTSFAVLSNPNNTYLSFSGHRQSWLRMSAKTMANVRFRARVDRAF